MDRSEFTSELPFHVCSHDKMVGHKMEENCKCSPDVITVNKTIFIVHHKLKVTEEMIDQVLNITLRNN